MNIPIVYESYHVARPPILFGDQVMLKDLTEKDGGFDQIINMKSNLEGAIVSLPLHHNEDFIDNFNADIRKLKWCIIVLTANEFGSDAYKQIKHPNMKIWLTTPKASDEADRFLPLGYPSEIEKRRFVPPIYDWFFSGQVTNKRREECVAVLKKLEGGKLRETEGFGQGFPYNEYVNLTAQAKVIPCPGGPETPDTFRLYEALELGCIPVVDKHSGAGNYMGDFWGKLFGDMPFKAVESWEEFPEILKDELANYEERSKEIATWWTKYKLKVVDNLYQDIEELRAKV